MKSFNLVTLEEATNEIRRYYAIGKNLAVDLVGFKEMLAHAAFLGKQRYGLSYHAAVMAMRFAEVYSEAEKNELCELCHKHFNAPCLSLIRMLLNVKNKTERRALQTQAIVDGWTTRQLRNEINHIKRLKCRIQALNKDDEPKDDSYCNEEDYFDSEEFDDD